jgi:hypothetical protein
MATLHENIYCSVFSTNGVESSADSRQQLILEYCSSIPNRQLKFGQSLLSKLFFKPIDSQRRILLSQLVFNEITKAVQDFLQQPGQISSLSVQFQVTPQQAECICRGFQACSQRVQDKIKRLTERYRLVNATVTLSKLGRSAKLALEFGMNSTLSLVELQKMCTVPEFLDVSQTLQLSSGMYLTEELRELFAVYTQPDARCQQLSCKL